MQEFLGQIAYNRHSILTSEEEKGLDQKFGHEVLGGAFKGMNYSESPICSEKWPKLIGSYEDELSELIERLIAKGFKRLIDVGCAEGFYAVGFALRCPSIQVVAVDPLKEAGQRLKRLGRANGVAGRIAFRRILSARALNNLVGDSTLILMDCEGAEIGLLKPLICKNLHKCEILIEVHDFVMPGMTEEIVSRFRDTHECFVIKQRRRNPKEYKCLDSLAEGLQQRLLDEHRPGRLCWLHLSPR